MRRLVVLDAGPLGLVTNPNASEETSRSAFWLRSLPSLGLSIVVPEIADYEVRRELIRGAKTNGIRRLDSMISDPNIRYLPLSTEVMRLAARLWAEARRNGTPTAHPHALDCDVILAAQALGLVAPDQDVIVATTNAVHLSLFVPAVHWQDILP